MARLVDVDELIEYFDGDLEGYDNREYILHMLDSKGRSARVEAIPIEWIKNEIGCSIGVVRDEDYDYDYAACILQLLDRWEKEHETD